MRVCPFFYSFREKNANTYLSPSNELSYSALGLVSVLATLTKHLLNIYQTFTILLPQSLSTCFSRKTETDNLNQQITNINHQNTVSYLIAFWVSVKVNVR